jgi:hypothetical protein
MQGLQKVVNHNSSLLVCLALKFRRGALSSYYLTKSDKLGAKMIALTLNQLV